MPSWIDATTRLWVRLTGRRIDLAHNTWLQGPTASLDIVDDGWLVDEAARRDADIAHDTDDAGLLASMRQLDNHDFQSGKLRASIRDFYEHTARWRLDAWVGWSPLAWPAGWVLSTVFARRLRQLALPLRSLDLTHGMTSTVVPLRRANQQVGALWSRRLRSNGSIVFSGLYDIVDNPDSGRKTVQVVFALPAGRLVVLLEPSLRHDGGLDLISNGKRWGAPGAYLVVERNGQSWARQIPIHELFQLYEDNEGVLRTDHRIDLFSLPVLRFHYRLTNDQR